MRRVKIGIVGLVAGIFIAGFFNLGWASTITIQNNGSPPQPCDAVPIHSYFNVFVQSDADVGDTVRVRINSNVDTINAVILKAVTPPGPNRQYRTSDSPIRVWDIMPAPLPPSFFCTNFIRGITGAVTATAIDIGGIFDTAAIGPETGAMPFFTSPPSLFNGVNAGPAVSISPDNNGNTDFLNIRFASGDTGPAWAVVDTNRDGTFTLTSNWAVPGDWTQPIWATGNNTMVLFWDGRDQKTGQALPNGNYKIWVHIESWGSGRWRDDTLTLNVGLSTAGCSGTVNRDTSPTPVQNAKVSMGNPECFGWAMSDTSGNYAIYGLKSGQYHGHAEAQNYAFADSGGISITTGFTPNINFALGGPGNVNVNVQLSQPNSTGDTLYGKVDIWSTEKPYGTGIGTSFGPGQGLKGYAISLAPGNYILKAFLPRYASQLSGPLAVVTNANTSCTIVLSKAGSISGTVTLPEANLTGNTMFIGVNANGSKVDNRGFGGAFILPNQNTGPFVVYDLLPDTYILQAHCDKYPDLFVSNVRVNTDTIGVVLTFTSGSRITGNVFLKKRSIAISNTAMKIEAYSPAINRGVVVDISCNSSPADETKTYELRGLEPARYFIKYKLEGFELPPMICDLGPNETRILNVTLERSKGAITGRVTNLKSPAHYSAVQILYSKLGESSLNTVPVEVGVNTGAYKIMNLTTGQYALIANKWVPGYPGFPSGEYPSLTKQVFVASGDTVANVDFSFITDTPGGITGMVNYTGTKGYNLTGKMVYAIPAAAAIQGAQTGWQTPIQINGSYLFQGLMPGAYKVKVETYLDTSNDMYGRATPDVLCMPRLVNVIGGNTVTGVNFTLTDGYKIKGNVVLPGPLSYEFHCGVDARIKGPRPEENHADVVITAGQTSASYELSALEANEYVVTVHSPDFIHAAREVKIIDNDVNNINFYLTKGASIKGKIIDAENGGVLPLVGYDQKAQGIYVHAEARPWKEGGYKDADMQWTQAGSSSVKFDQEGKFTISNLPAGTYEVIISCPSVEMGKSFVNMKVGGMVVPNDPSMVVDIGVLALKPGVTISGKAMEMLNPATGETKPLANIPVNAKISGIAPDYWERIRTMTRLDGSYTLSGISPEKYYDVMAGMEMGEFDFASNYGGVFGPRYGLDVRRAVPPRATDVNFTLVQANCAVQGTISKGETEPLRFSKGNVDKAPGAIVVLKKMGTPPIGDNPIMDGLLTLSMPTDNLGKNYRFERGGLVSGKYIAKIFADGYAMASKANLEIKPGMNDLGNFTLLKGGSVTGTITKEDGSAVNEKMAERVIATTHGFTKVAFGMVNTNPSSREVINYLVEGLEQGNTYSLAVAAKMGRDIYISTEPLYVPDTGTITRNIVMKDFPPKFHLLTRKIVNKFKLEIQSVQPLTEAKAEDVVTLITGGGALSNYRMDGDKMRVEVEYTPLPGEDSFTIQAKGHSESGKEGAALFKIYSGADAQIREHVNIFQGGTVNVGEGDGSSVDLTDEAVTLKEGNETGTAEVTIDKLQTMLTSSGAPKLSASAYPFVVPQTTANPGVRVSAIYNVVLNLFGNLFSGKGLTVTLDYDTSAASVDDMNIFYYNETTKKWEIETSNRSVDADNHTISVEVNHLSQFSTFNTTFQAGFEKLTTYNYPNPFKPTLGQVSTTIMVGLKESDKVSVKIYNLAGELVRAFADFDGVTGKNANVTWDGKNDAGEPVASGVYVYVVKTTNEVAVNKIMVIR